MSKSYLFTSESVSEGHPDKVADQISDAVLDAILTDDPKGRVACETLVTTGMAFLAGEVSTSTYVDIPKLVRETIQGIGYTRERAKLLVESAKSHLVTFAESPAKEAMNRLADYVVSRNH